MFLSMPLMFFHVPALFFQKPGHCCLMSCSSFLCFSGRSCFSFFIIVNPFPFVIQLIFSESPQFTNDKFAFVKSAFRIFDWEKSALANFAFRKEVPSFFVT